MRVLTASQMREADRQTIQDLGVPSVVLMENAGRQVAAAVESLFDDMTDRQVAVLAGRGNNGGDGFVVARTLAQRACGVLVGLVGRTADVRGDARINLDILRKLGIPVIEITTPDEWDAVAPDLLGGDVVVDALFGTGLSAPLSGLVDTIVAELNASDVPVVSIDLPSGLSADSGTPIGPAVSATMTVTLGALKLPLVLPPAESLAGALVVADIGIPGTVLASVDGPKIDFVLRRDARALMPARDRNLHKGSFGHVCLVAGSPGKTGAAFLGGMAALRSGAGLCTVATPAGALPVVAALGAEYMTVALPEDADGRASADAVAVIASGRYDVIAAGPGLGTSDAQRDLVRGLLAHDGPRLVLDADAITVMAASPAGLTARADQVVVITPHPGEMARLIGTSAAEVQSSRLDVARNCARTRNVIVVLKGHRTLVAAPDGRVFVNSTGNPGMATGGSGDVLTGAIAGWLAQIDDPVEACVLAVHLHGLAGDIAARGQSEAGLTAGDILDALGHAARDLESQADDAEDAEDGIRA